MSLNLKQVVDVGRKLGVIFVRFEIMGNCTNGKYVSPPALTGRYIVTRTDFGSSRFADDEDGDGPRNAGLLAVQPLDGAANPRIFYWKWIATFCNYLFMFLLSGFIWLTIGTSGRYL